MRPPTGSGVGAVGAWPSRTCAYWPAINSTGPTTVKLSACRKTEENSRNYRCFALADLAPLERRAHGPPGIDAPNNWTGHDSQRTAVSCRVSAAQDVFHALAGWRKKAATTQPLNRRRAQGSVRPVKSREAAPPGTKRSSGHGLLKESHRMPQERCRRDRYLLARQPSGRAPPTHWQQRTRTNA